VTFEDMTKNELEEHGRTLGIELDRRLTKSVLIDQLNEHLSTPEENLDPIYEDAELEEEWGQADIEHPLMPEDIAVAPIAEEVFVDPMQAIQEEADARRIMQNKSEELIQIQAKYEVMKQRRIDAEVAEIECVEELDKAKTASIDAELKWSSLAEKL
jgi:PP-loop superfamily ATP-utilizing enzyme